MHQPRTPPSRGRASVVDEARSVSTRIKLGRNKKTLTARVKVNFLLLIRTKINACISAWASLPASRLLPPPRLFSQPPTHPPTPPITTTLPPAAGLGGSIFFASLVPLPPPSLITSIPCPIASAASRRLETEGESEKREAKREREVESVRVVAH